MAFLFLGLMQYSVSNMKANEERRIKLIDDNEKLKIANSTLQIEKAELLEMIEDYKKTVRRYHDFSSKILKKYKELQEANKSDTQKL